MLIFTYFWWYYGLRLKDRQWTCDNCYAHHDRDENACLNLYNYNNHNINTKYSNNTAVGTTVNACGGNVRPKTSKKNISKKSRAINNFKSKDLSCFQWNKNPRPLGRGSSI